MIVYIDMCTLHTLQRRTADIAWSRCAASPRVGLIFRNRSAFAQSPLQPCIRRTYPLSPTLVRACFSKLDIKHGSPMQVSSLKKLPFVHSFIGRLRRTQSAASFFVSRTSVYCSQCFGHHFSSCPPTVGRSCPTFCTQSENA